MPDKISINEELKYVTILSFGEVTIDDISESIDIVSKLFHEGKINKVLVDTRKQKRIPRVFSLSDLSEKFPFGLKIALLATEDQFSFYDLSFLETTSLNKGKNLILVNSIEEAKKWLLNENHAITEGNAHQHEPYT
ncbi:MAG: hypothetical protein JKY54_04850 [Flavobacteriales bacterium]|nr:hypothetical protein [Flavobacteriales bacterium]